MTEPTFAEGYKRGFDAGVETERQRIVRMLRDLERECLEDDNRFHSTTDAIAAGKFIDLIEDGK